jgi:phage N-6-adenine-methyltransferase
MSKLSDEWRTPQWLFDELNKEFNFDTDVCATKDNAKCPRFLKDALINTEWAGIDKAFMNPPYSNPFPFVNMAYIQSKYGRTIVCLLKVDTSTKWWSVFWDYQKHCPKSSVEVRFLPKRIKFEPPMRYEGKVTTPAFPSCIVIMRPR